jgi:2-keto-4-pentenoate hydratase/2-oxohepta-3-ene-1,7-dioic acid hydratase in catechol pathway
MKIAQFSQSGKDAIGVHTTEGWIDFTKAHVMFEWIRGGVFTRPLTSLGAWLQSGTFDAGYVREVIRFIRKERLDRTLAIERTAVMKAPIERPVKIVALGLNYALHAAEGKFQVPSEPIIFLKAGSSVVGPDETVRIPRGMGRMDHEVELAAIIGTKASGVNRRNASSYIAGYTIANDVSARDLQTKDLEKRHPWFRSKSFDTFTPLGPWMVTADEIKPPVHLDIECRVNGKVRQKANTRDMVFDIPTVIEFISRYITLEPGDVISTGTPEGIGPIRHGDTMVCRIQKIGELRNPVRNK